MKRASLEVTYRKGKPLAAYLCLPRRSGDKSVRTERPVQGLVVDYAADGRPIGIEIISPQKVNLRSLNRVLRAIRQSPLARRDLAPLLAGE